MNKQMLIIGTVFLLLIVGLSGCTNEIGDLEEDAQGLYWRAMIGYSNVSK